ncbi:hypothetical protein BH93_17800 [Rhodococcoides fascians A25f]|uniref:hypothetical protein n=1 Tax=Rhodococcoides fascians TaxID=1828 RepID=UPI000B2953FB|nr:hypothetical protein [Rhodococcus fascians]QII06954.1 hypothetical protein BH93_17800 [Rhodococcus fascians A25f]
MTDVLIAPAAFTTTDPDTGAEVVVPQGARTAVGSQWALADPDRWVRYVPPPPRTEGYAPVYCSAG